MTMKVCHTPTEVAVRKPSKCSWMWPSVGRSTLMKSPPFMRMTARGEPIMAPPPKPMMAMPVAMPRRSGNHLISVETGEM